MSPWFMLIGAAISALVTVLKGIPFVERNPKLIATGLSLLATSVQAVGGARPGKSVWTFAAYAAAQLAAAVGTHEVLIKTFTPPEDPTARPLGVD